MCFSTTSSSPKKQNEVKNLLGSNLVTHQTDKNGLPIHQVLIETPSNIYFVSADDKASVLIVMYLLIMTRKD